MLCHNMILTAVMAGFRSARSLEGNSCAQRSYSALSAAAASCCLLGYVPKSTAFAHCTILQMQKEYLDGKIRQLSNSHVVHPGIKRQLMPLQHARMREIAVRIDPKDVPGVAEAGWTPPGKPG